MSGSRSLDHFAVGATIAHSNTKVKSGREGKSNTYISPKNVSKVSDELSKINWDEMMEIGGDIDEQFTDFYKRIQTIIKENCEVKISSKRHSDQPWVTQEIKDLRRKIKILARKFKHKYIEQKYITYKALKKQLKKDERNARSEHIRKELKRATPKETWNIINKLLSRKMASSTIDKLTTVTGETITEESQIAQRLNDYYSTIGHKLAKNLPCPKNDPLNNLKTTDTTFKIGQIYPNDLLETLYNMSNKTSYSHDLISNCMLKQIALPIILAPLTYFVSRIYEEGHIPKVLKTSHTIFLRKCKNAQKESEFRPICLVPAILKLADKLFTPKLDKYLSIICERSNSGPSNNTDIRDKGQQKRRYLKF